MGKYRLVRSVCCSKDEEICAADTSRSGTALADDHTACEALCLMPDREQQINKLSVPSWVLGCLLFGLHPGLLRPIVSTTPYSLARESIVASLRLFGIEGFDGPGSHNNVSRDVS